VGLDARLAAINFGADFEDKCVFGRSNWTKAFTPRLPYFPFALPFVISGWRGRRKIGRNGWLAFRNQIAVSDRNR
jgi:hypothetical protein